MKLIEERLGEMDIGNPCRPAIRKRQALERGQHSTQFAAQLGEIRSRYTGNLALAVIGNVYTSRLRLTAEEVNLLVLVMEDVLDTDPPPGNQPAHLGQQREQH
ncbi:hypothetical protein D9M68_985660 [compost metagenome]